MSDEGVLRIIPVGVVKSEIESASLVVRGGGLAAPVSEGGRGRSRHSTSEILVFDKYADCLEGIEGFSHLLVLYWSHKITDEGRAIHQVHPAGQSDIPLKGVFATRSPARPNPICVTTVGLLSREGSRLKVEGLDAVDGSPVVDIKPHHPYFDAPGDVRLAGWMEELMRRFSASGDRDSRDRGGPGGTGANNG